MADATREGLRAAANRLARAMRVIAAVRTRHTAEAVRVYFDGEEAVVSAGREGGAWGWEPIQAAMFDDNGRHPLYGDKKHWYHQGRWPITAMTERAALDSAVNAFADTAIPLLLKEYGLD